MTNLRIVLLCVCALGGCSPTGSLKSLNVVDPGLVGLALTSVAPSVWVPGTTVLVRGRSFPPSEFGTAELVLQHRAGAPQKEIRVPLSFVDYTTMQGQWMGDSTDVSSLTGTAFVEVHSYVTGETVSSSLLLQELVFERHLEPRIDSIATEAAVHVNEAIVFEGEGFLLGGFEGTADIEIEGCYARADLLGCVDTMPTRAPVHSADVDRYTAEFRFEPGIIGTIQPGTFYGRVRVINEHADGEVLLSDWVEVIYDIQPVELTQINPTAVSLGQFVFIQGGGFVGDSVSGSSSTEENALTSVRLDGVAVVDGGETRLVDNLLLFPDFVSGSEIRYALSEQDLLGRALDLRDQRATFTGTAQAIVEYGHEISLGPKTDLTLVIEPVKQVVLLDYLSTYVETLRAFGMRAVDSEVRDRALIVLERDYEGVNIEFRSEAVEDFAVYSRVEVSGKDPSGAGTLGLDNTPGKDSGNIRLHDQIGGANSVRQSDDAVGYGGVFLQSFFAFSEHPNDYADKSDLADSLFDKIFDPFRRDRGGRGIDADDLAKGFPTVDSGSICPSDDRPEQIACAVFVLGNLIGGTLTHELGHSLGLSNPDDTSLSSVHNRLDNPSAIMDRGAYRPFTERTELEGAAPGAFCAANYAYLRQILPSGRPASDTPRRKCR